MSSTISSNLLVPKQKMFSNALFYAVVFSGCSILRKRILIRNYTHNTLTPLCQLILTYEHKISGSYHRRFVLFLLASTLSTLMCNHINTIEKTEKINEGQETRRISQILGRHGSNLEYFFNPIIFCVMFKVPVMLGVASGILLKSIKEHLFEQLKDSMEE